MSKSSPHQKQLTTQQEEILSQREQLVSRDAEIEHLKLLIAKLRRLQFGRSSEKREYQIEQLELRLEELEARRTKETAAVEKSPSASTAVVRPVRRPLPISCHGKCESIFRSKKLVRTVEVNVLRRRCFGNLGVRSGQSQSHSVHSSQASLPRCDRIVQAEAPSRPIERGIAGPGLLAHVLVSKYCDHLPLYRQSQIFARTGVELDRSTLAEWVGGSSRLLAPLVEALRRHVMAADKLHADDTPVPVLAPGLGKTKTGRLWTYVRDDRPAGDSTPAAVWFAYSPDRKGEHPQSHLSNFTGTLQADGYAGFDQIYEARRIQEAACWAHVRRKFYDLEVAHKSPVAAEALERIAGLYAIEKEIRGRPPDERREVQHVRQAVAGIAETMVRRDLRETLAKIRYGYGRSLRTRTVGSTAALL